MGQPPVRLTAAERSARDRSLPRCLCGNIARSGETQCGRCLEEAIEQERKANTFRFVIQLPDAGPWSLKVVGDDVYAFSAQSGLHRIDDEVLKRVEID